MHTDLCDRLDIEFPIFAFTHCRDVVVAVSQAGGFGVLGAVGHTPESLEIDLNWIDEHVDGKPYGVDLIVPTSLADKEGALTPEELRRAADAAGLERAQLVVDTDRHVSLQLRAGQDAD